MVKFLVFTSLDAERVMTSFRKESELLLFRPDLRGEVKHFCNAMGLLGVTHGA